VVEARTVPGAGEHPVLKMPSRVLASSVPPRRDRAALQLPANQNFQYRAGQYIEFILRDGARRSYSMANAPDAAGQPAVHRAAHAPHARRAVHRPGVLTLKEKDILRMEGPFGSFFLREDSDQADRAAGQRHRLCADQGADRAHAATRASPARPVLYWGCRRKADLYLHDWCLQQAAGLPGLRYVPVLSEPTPTTPGPAAPASCTRR
jgi:CDP-4-dehydro-6-deoxyglucose reductase